MTITGADATPGPEGGADADVALLAQFGYRQELRRKLSGFSNFAVSFSIISVLAGCLTSYSIAMANGGPAAITLGWLGVGVMVTVVALAMAEICSVYPTAGALYWWAFALARTNKAAWAWFVGWFNFLGQVAVTAAIDFGAALTTTAFLNLTVDLPVTTLSTFTVFLVIIALHGLLNTFGVNLVKILSDVSAWWHIVGVAVIVGVLVVVPDKHYDLRDVFLQTANATGLSGTGAAVLAFLLGLLMAQYTFTGYDASAHVSEETHDAQIAAPRGIVSSVVVSVIAGFALLFAVTWAIQDYDGALGSATKFPPAQIFIDAAGNDLGIFLLFICVVAQFFCGMASVTANSRMAYAFSRDGALPGSRLWKKVNPRTGTPTNSIWLCVVCSTLLVLPSLWNTTAYLAATAISVIGLYVAYATPIYLRLRNPDFVQGPWNLGRYSRPIGWIAVIWVGLICVLFVLPGVYPITVANFNYTIAAVALVLGGAALWWTLSAKHWFTGPRTTITTPTE
ncbi:amino acid permease (GABA permease) [Allocatelliglobosispora scoriae]|uniref:Amino acid permease (GABA permease) n=1 Tax=Allocatelliglobosispora scoriae TaxID=643052 RepID=A0A841BQS4_9ACTN|nr:amino acid permease [Allocatelliglobosispora scoriae]MBB5869171.1 amino acid permease (GABA permease) [Allocatelliglobosispora scoriae]